MSGLQAPETDLADFTDQLGQAWAVGSGESIIQYVVWAETAGVFSLFTKSPSVTLDDICAQTSLSDAGADALLGVLLSLKLLSPLPDGRFALTLLAREYLLSTSPWYIGAGLQFRNDKPIPPIFLRGYSDSFDWDSNFDEARARSRLPVQHSRNFAPGVVAVKSGSFEGVNHLIDMGGGSGVFAIPLALDYPDLKLTLVDLPVCLSGIRDLLRQYGVEKRVELVGMDMFGKCWDLPECDGILFGNIFHVFGDAQCHELCRRAFHLLAPGGRLWLHEVLFNERRDGPMIAALWNANMRTIGGRQRTAAEFTRMLESAGFACCSVTPTAGRFSLIVCTKPAVANVA